MKQVRFYTLILLILTTSLGAFARVDVKKTKKLSLPKDISEPVLSSETAKKIQPNKIEKDESSQSVLSKMFDNTVSFLWEHSDVKKTSLGAAADKLDKNLKTEMNLGKSKNSKTEHKVSVKLLAMQALAKIEYKGWVRAGLNYDARAAKTEAELVEDISTNKDLVLSHSVTSQENKSQMSFRWNW